MRTFTCTCGQLLFFENAGCVACNRELGFLPDLLTLSSLEMKDTVYVATDPKAKGRTYKKCQNYTSYQVCNWMIPANKEDGYCISCRLNTMIPDLSQSQNIQLWALIEAAKRRLVYSALQLKLPLANRMDEPIQGLGFSFIGDINNPDGTVTRAITQHENGLITLNIEEADDAVREKNRLGLREPYRTLLGHFRHESGHYYWDRLILNTPFLEEYRGIFGDERLDYDQAMQTYYQNGAPANWQENFISVYATMHPWEDWAESWAHFMHIQDTLEVAIDFGLINKRFKIDPNAPVKKESFENTLEKWSELTLALNSINRSMGLRDLYPFVLSPTVVAKLRFVSEVIAGSPSVEI